MSDKRQHIKSLWIDGDPSILNNPVVGWNPATNNGIYVEGANNCCSVNHPTHGYSLSDYPIPVWQDVDGKWFPANASSAATSSYGIITNVIDANNYLVCVSSGIFKVVGGHNLDVDKHYFLSNVNSGQVTDIPPQNQQPIFNVLDSERLQYFHYPMQIGASNMQEKVETYGRVAANGAALSGNNFSIVKAGTGIYDVNFATALPNDTYGIMLTAAKSAGTDDYNIGYTNVTTTGFRVVNDEQDDGGGGGTDRDTDFTFFVLY